MNKKENSGMLVRKCHTWKRNGMLRLWNDVTGSKGEEGHPAPEEE